MILKMQNIFTISTLIILSSCFFKPKNSKIKSIRNLLTVSAILLFGSCNSDFYLKDDFKLVKKIDAHIHYNSESNAFSEQAKEDNFSLIDINLDYPDHFSIDAMEKFSLNQKKQFPDQFEFITSFTLQNWDSRIWAGQTIEALARSFGKGALGVKIWKNIGMEYKDQMGNFIMIDNPRFDTVVQYIVKQDKMILGHLGEPKNCWLPLEKMTIRGDSEYFKENPQYHMYLRPDYPSYQAQIDTRDRFVEKHPNLRFVGAHLGSLEWDVDELSKRLDKFPNMAVDLAARLVHIELQSIKNYNRIRNFMIKYQDQLIYATDETFEGKSGPAAFKKKMHEIWLEDWRYLITDESLISNDFDGNFKGLKLPKSVVDKIYRLNAIRWYKILKTNKAN